MNEYIDKIKNIELKESIKNMFDYLEKTYNFSDKPAAKTHHHNYRGGLAVHTSEVCDNALKLNKSWGFFEEDSIIKVALLHDVMKAKSYQFKKYKTNDREYIDIVSGSCSGEAWVFNLCNKFNVELTESELSAIEFAHGGWSTQAKDFYIKQSKLSYLLHCADLLSANFGEVNKK